MPKLFHVCPCILAFSLVGSRSSPQAPSSAGESESLTVREIKLRARDAYARGHFRDAAAEYRKGFDLAIAEGRRGAALVCLNNVAGSQLAAFEYLPALDSFLNARRLARELNNRPVEAVVWLNLSSLYITLRNYDAAEHAALRASQMASGLSRFPYRAEILAQLASFQVRRGDLTGGLRLFEEAINRAADSGNESLRATLNDRAGWILMERGSYADAEPFVLEAFRLRRLSGDRDLRSSYIATSRLSLAQGKISLAAALIDVAASLPVYDAGPALWLAQYQRGLVRMAQNRVPEARDAFALAGSAANAWHEGASFSDQSRMAADVGTHELAQALVDADILAGATAEAFVAAEEDRAAGLRQITRDLRHSPELDGELASRLGRLREAQTELLTKPGPESRKRVDQLRSELSEYEAGRYLTQVALNANIRERTSTANTLRGIQARIRPEEALLSFYLGPKATYLWAATSTHFEFHRLPAEAVLSDLAARTSASIESNAANRDKLSADLYAKLFGELSPAVQRQKHWIITADDELFLAPYPALIVSRSESRPPGRTTYLAELHSIERIASAWMLSATGSEIPRGRFLGIADGIYNGADPRWPNGRRPDTPLQLARLAQSSKEVEACGRLWEARSPAMILTGERATRLEFQRAVQQGPAVIHFAAHFLFPADRRDETVIHLGLNGEGKAELLTREDVANLNTPGSVVVMNGCSSAAGGAAAGAGILGLSRAWLIAGASTIVGSLWPTPDDSGELFERFYHYLLTAVGEPGNGPIERAAADALESAQIEMIRSATWRSAPRYWSAFFVMGRN